MRVAALYDIHGNLPALEAVLDDVRRVGVDLVLVGGDVVPGPMPRECLEVLDELEIPTRYISGNGEREVLAAREGMSDPRLPDHVRSVLSWVGDALDEITALTLSRWPGTELVTVDGLGPVLFCHATPEDDNEIFTERSPEDRLRLLFDGVDASVVVCGHTHMPFDRMVGDVRVVNAGSVGMPFGHIGADWLLLGPDIELRHIGYDLSGAAERVRDTTYPGAESFARDHILTAPDAESVLALFEDEDEPVGG